MKYENARKLLEMKKKIKLKIALDLTKSQLDPALRAVLFCSFSPPFLILSPFNSNFKNLPFRTNPATLSASSYSFSSSSSRFSFCPAFSFLRLQVPARTRLTQQSHFFMILSSLATLPFLSLQSDLCCSRHSIPALTQVSKISPPGAPSCRDATKPRNLWIMHS